MKTSSNDKVNLASAFDLFSKQSAQLQNAYLELQKDLKNHHDLLSLIVTHISQGLIFIDSFAVISLFNTAAQTLLEIPVQKALGEKYEMLFPDTFFGFSLKEALEQGKSKELVFLTLPNEKEIEVAVTLLPEASGVILLLKDITQLTQLNQSLERNDRLSELGKMATSLAHEIRNPLGGIEGFAALLSHDLEKAPKQKNMADAILEGSKTLNRLVSNMCHFTRPLTVHFSKVDLIPLIQQSIALFEANHKKRAQISFHFPKEPHLVCLADKDLLKGALLNLFINASEAKGEIKVALTTETKKAIITVSDNGTGIKPSELKRLFTPFFTTKPTGTGLGLAEVQKTIQAHGGSIEVKSELNYGTQFILSLPLEKGVL